MSWFFPSVTLKNTIAHLIERVESCQAAIRDKSQCIGKHWNAYRDHYSGGGVQHFQRRVLSSLNYLRYIETGMAPRVCDWGGGGKSKFDQLESVNVEVWPTWVGQYWGLTNSSRSVLRLPPWSHPCIVMVQVLMQFLWAEQCGDWLLHLSATAAMASYFFAFDRPNSSMWLPVYLADMNNLPDSHPSVHQDSINGNLSMSLSGNAFSCVSTDMTFEHYKQGLKN